MLTIQNDYLTVKINPLGAEVTSVKDNASHLEYMWQADQNVWGRHSPVLFPIVGRLKDNQYTVAEQTYHMTQHGFARDRVFTVDTQTAEQVTLCLNADAASKQLYPFDFNLTITYTLVAHELQTKFNVFNPSDTTLPFSLGAHPGINVPLGDPNRAYTDYTITVAPKQNYAQIPLVGPFSDHLHPIDRDLTKPLTLDHALFEHDALVLPLSGESTVMLSTPLDDHGVALTTTAPYLGIWSAYPKTGSFVCFEPWWGLADDVHADGNFDHKYALRRLAAQQTFTAGYQITYF